MSTRLGEIRFFFIVLLFVRASEALNRWPPGGIENARAAHYVAGCPYQEEIKIGILWLPNQREGQIRILCCGLVTQRNGIESFGFRKPSLALHLSLGWQSEIDFRQGFGCQNGDMVSIRT
ncbi:unnamed protein product [Arabidopsis halleri]